MVALGGIVQLNPLEKEDPEIVNVTVPLTQTEGFNGDKEICPVAWKIATHKNININQSLDVFMVMLIVILTIGSYNDKHSVSRFYHPDHE